MLYAASDISRTDRYPTEQIEMLQMRMERRMQKFGQNRIIIMQKQ